MDGARADLVVAGSLVGLVFSAALVFGIMWLVRQMRRVVGRPESGMVL